LERISDDDDIHFSHEFGSLARFPKAWENLHLR